MFVFVFVFVLLFMSEFGESIGNAVVVVFVSNVFIVGVFAADTTAFILGVCVVVLFCLRAFGVSPKKKGLLNFGGGVRPD